MEQLWGIGSATSHSGIADHLRYVSVESARSVLEKRGATAEIDILWSAIACGMALETYLKWVLAKLSPNLVASLREDGAATMIYLSGHRGLDGMSPTGIRTITAANALTQVIRIHPELKTLTKHCDDVFSTRNAAAHMGLVSTIELATAIEKLVRIINCLEILQGKMPKDFWGLQAAAATAIVDEAASEAQRSLETKLSGARKRFAELNENYDQERLERVLSEMERQTPRYLDLPLTESAWCPACGREARVGLTAVPAEYGRDEDGNPSSNWEMCPDSLECTVCSLNLSEAEYDEFTKKYTF
ncbi:hypothetical protein E3T55_19780 [Cryobacterium frigoriphilum]|uniref:Uncharacterized protein n=1 Tax=Cryobacterium frigoriphilum TaxID=1259150 RepID=A0A4R8ZT44_9MICO|nr:hypothetical protein [Cryobacterium frigoriphilum]TFD44806.1 hypothetical protein E3T55_19780 [Cryobacterium frigoriphilum]